MSQTINILYDACLFDAENEIILFTMPVFLYSKQPIYIILKPSRVAVIMKSRNTGRAG